MFTHIMRHLQGASDNLVVEMQITDREKFFNYFRMTPEIFEELLTLVGPRIQKKDVCRIPISPRIRLQLTLRWLASGDSLASHSYAFRIASNTASKIVRETCTALWEVLKDKVFLQSTVENWQQVADKFQEICQFPNYIGSIDGKHIIVQAPPNSGSSYYNYKGNHSINLLAIKSGTKNCRMFIWDTSGKVANFSSANYRSRFNG
ncbi:nuclease harbi1-like protein [Lasius niger]|uniref:Nuclease harbi1-like protein n=1 Tax=Lasius niger TaxID=67767 RepID=A0A0J7K750_LASNI|nr:nuclease harbi1-like protein [Lasius niger]